MKRLKTFNLKNNKSCASFECITFTHTRVK